MKDIIDKIKGQAKQLTIDISQIGDGKTKEELHGDAIELLLSVNELETIYNQTYPKTQDVTQNKKEIRSITKSKEEDLIGNEINKLHHRLPRWAKNQQQINSKILTLYLKLEEEGVSSITEQTLMERYNNHQEFYRNFPQMKTISTKNHGKVFDVQNGVVTIWEHARPIVQEYKNKVINK